MCLAWAVCAGAAIAACQGTDLRATLSDAERAALTERIADMDYPRGLFWRATRGNLELYVIGTLHADDRRLEKVMARVAPILETADTLFVEATSEDEKRLQEAVTARPELLFLTSGPTLPELMAEEDWQRLANAAQDRGLPGFIVAKFQPWYLSVVLSLPACVLEEMQQGGNGLDHRLIAAADASGVRQKGLEPYDTLFQLMGAVPMDQQIDFLTLGVLPDDVSEDALASLKASYFEERTAEILEHARILSRRYVDLPEAEIDALYDDMLDTLLVARNIAWMDRLLAAPAGTHAVAVGAGHLPGRSGLLALLEAAGFRLTRLPL